MNLEFRLESRALSEQVLGSVEGIVNVHVSVVTTDTLGKVLGALSSLLAALLLHPHINSVEDLVAEILRGFRQLIRKYSNSLDVGNHVLVASLDRLNDKSAHAKHDSCCRAGVNTSRKRYQVTGRPAPPYFNL
jgi:hypothetical protein